MPEKTALTNLSAVINFPASYQGVTGALTERWRKIPSASKVREIKTPTAETYRIPKRKGHSDKTTVTQSTAFKALAMPYRPVRQKATVSAKTAQVKIAVKKGEKFA